MIDPQYTRQISTYTELLARYKDIRFEHRDGSAAEAELTAIENKLASRPPRVEQSPGVFVPRPKGLQPRNLAERIATEAYGPPLKPMVAGDAIAATDLVPKLVYPVMVKLAGGYERPGQQWFDENYKDRLPTPIGEPREFKRIAKKDWPDLIKSGEAPDPRQFLVYVQDQDGVGSCGAEGMGGADDVRRGMFNGRPTGEPEAISPNPWFAYHTTSGGSDQGSSLEDNVAFYQKFGCARQAVWPRSKGWRAKPSNEAYEDAEGYKTLEVVAFPTSDTELLGTLLLSGVPVYTGYSGHAWFAVWLVSTSKLVWVNSWSPSWGDSGMGTLSFSSLQYGCFAVLNTMVSDKVYR